MKDYDDKYYMSNIPWRSKLNLDSILKFQNLKFTDTIIFHYNLAYSIFKTEGNKSISLQAEVTVNSINVCLRYYQILKELYPYNKIRVIIYINDKIRCTVKSSVYQKIIDIIPNFALVAIDSADVDNNIKYFDKPEYKHILYGMSLSFKNYFNISDVQKWETALGNLIVKEEVKRNENN